MGEGDQGREHQSEVKRGEVPDDLVGAISFLTSDDAAFMTGQTLNVDGAGADVGARHCEEGEARRSNPAHKCMRPRVEIASDCFAVLAMG